MCKGLEDLKQDYAESCLKQQAIESTKIMLEDGISIERVAKYSNLPIETVEELQKSFISQ